MLNKVHEDIAAVKQWLDDKLMNSRVLTERTAVMSVIVCSSILTVSCLSVLALSIRARNGMTVTDSTDMIGQTEATTITIPYSEFEEETQDYDETSSPEDLNASLIVDILAKGNYDVLGSITIDDDEEVSEEVIKRTAPKDLNDRQVTKMLSGGAGEVRIIDRKDINEGAASSGSSEDTGNLQAEISAASDNSGVVKKFDTKNNYVIGIDVSSWNGNINWQKVKAYGVQFVMIKCGGRYWGSGLLYKDKQFETNIKGANAAGLDVGVYFYSAAVSITEAYEEASYVVNLIKGYKVKLPVAIDFEINSKEYRHADVKGKDLRDILCTFCDTVKSQGYTPMVYMSKSCWTSVLGSSYASEVSAKYKVWLAAYYNRFINGTEPFKIGDKLPTFGYNYDIWQYGYCKGVVPGISGSVDMNLGFFASTDLTDPSITVPNSLSSGLAAGSSIDIRKGVKVTDSLGNEVDMSFVSVSIKDAEGNTVKADSITSAVGTYEITYSFIDPYYGTITKTVTLTVSDKTSPATSSAEPTAAASTTAAPAVSTTAPASETAAATTAAASATSAPAPASETAAESEIVTGN